MSFSSNPLDFRVIFKENNITPDIRDHLVKVYLTLGVCLSVVSLGVVLHILFSLGGMLSFLATIGLTILLSLSRDPSNNNNNNKYRLTLLLLLSVFNGISIGPLIALAAVIDPNIIITAFIMSAGMFFCFTLSALIAKRTTYLYLGGILSSSLVFLFFISLFNMFIGSSLLYKLQLLGGLIIFCGYVLFDTQMIVERRSSGDSDYIWHAVQLLVDFIAIFVRVLIILLKQNKNRNQQRDSIV